ncbi:MAG TPA: hypothetical protein VHM70_24920 [Polyangiaceae bacterium]|jgi:hypothetical protein|nr:hypothetical protein [Polyangiaceae bacterium]
MVTREQLIKRGLWAYETGQLRAAARVAFIVLPMTALCLIETRDRALCSLIAGTLLIGSIGLRWLNRDGRVAASAGLRAGLIPLGAGLILDHFGTKCALGIDPVFCTLCASAAGAWAGLYLRATLAKHSNGTRAQRIMLLLAMSSVGALAAALGCVRLGLVGLGATLASLILVPAVSALGERFAQT